MIVENSIVPALIFTGIVVSLAALANFVSASLYEARELKKLLQFQKHPHSRRYRSRPRVTVIIVTYNDEQRIGGCLESFTRSLYRKLEIIVVDNCSRDHTTRQVRLYRQTHPNSSIRLIARQTADRPRRIALQAYRRYGTGQLLAVIDAGYRLPKASLQNAVWHFNDEANLQLVLPRRQTRVAFTLTGLFCRYQEFLQARWKKMGSLTQSVAAIDLYGVIGRQDIMTSLLGAGVGGAQASKFDDALLLSARKQPTLRYQYASDVTVSTAAPRSFYQLCRQYYRRQLAGWHVWSPWLPGERRNRRSQVLTVGYAAIVGSLKIALVLAPLVVSYCVYLAIRLHEPALLVTSVAGVSIYILAAIWSDNQLKLRHKLAFGLGLPVTYGLFYALSVVHIVVFLRALLDGRNVYDRLKAAV